MNNYRCKSILMILSAKVILYEVKCLWKSIHGIWKK